MSEFTNFLSETENNEEMKTALNQVVSEIISKDSLYEPMKSLREQLPKWLEENWEKCSQEDLERYNKQMDLINEICTQYESNQSTASGNESSQESDKIFELLGKL